MLDQHHLEQHHRVDAGAPIILTIERLHHFIQLCEVHRCIYPSQQMLLRHQLVYDYELYQVSIHFPAFQHLSSPLPILPYLSEKAQLQPDFFDRLKLGSPVMRQGFPAFRAAFSVALIPPFWRCRRSDRSPPLSAYRCNGGRAGFDLARPVPQWLPADFQAGGS